MSKRNEKYGRYLQLRGNIYYFRMALPEAGDSKRRRECILSLKPSDKDVARRMAMLIAGRVGIETTRVKSMSQMTYPQLDQLINGYFQTLYANNVIQPCIPQDREARDAYLLEAHEDEAHLYEEYAHTKQPRTKTVNGLVAASGLCPVDSDSPEHIYLADGVYQADMEANRLWIEKIRRPQVTPVPSGRFSPPQAASSASTPQDDKTYVGPAGVLRVRELIEAYAEHKTLHKRWTEETRKDNLSKLNLFGDFIGQSRFLHTITPQEFAEYNRSLTLMPRNMNKMPKYRHMSLREAARASKEGDLVTPQTASKHYECVMAMFDHAVNAFYLRHNPVPKLRKDVRYEKAERPCFTPEQLAALFGSPIFNEYKFYKKAGEFWVPLLGAYTGARLDELVGLEADDVITYNGCHYLYIRPNSLRRLKNKTSTRLIPLHPDVVQAGFMEYVGMMKAKRRLPVFYDLHRNKKAADAMGKHFSHLLKRLGMKRKGEKVTLCFHSLRHTFANRMAELGVSREIRMGLMGHAMGDTHSDYVKNFPVTLTYPEICKLSYGLELDKLLKVKL